MYEKFYRFKNRPFNLTPDTEFFFPSAKHEEALNRLLLAISEKSGFAVITGEIGSGKTTVCRTVLNKLDPTTKVALILNTHLGKKELLTTILEDLDIEYKSGSKTHIMAALNRYLIEQAEKDTNVVIIIDEAQNLTPSVLEEVRMLSNLETETEKLVQIVLLGQPELRKKLAHPQLEQFRQRIVLSYHLGPLDRNETENYIKHRLKKAGNKNADIFTNGAIDRIYEYSRGVPRLINLACHNSLISGLVYETRCITEKIAADAMLELVHGVDLTPTAVASKTKLNTETLIEDAEKNSTNEKKNTDIENITSQQVVEESDKAHENMPIAEQLSLEASHEKCLAVEVPEISQDVKPDEKVDYQRSTITAQDVIDEIYNSADEKTSSEYIHEQVKHLKKSYFPYLIATLPFLLIAGAVSHYVILGKPNAKEAVETSGSQYTKLLFNGIFNRYFIKNVLFEGNAEKHSIILKNAMKLVNRGKLGWAGAAITLNHCMDFSQKNFLILAKTTRGMKPLIFCLRDESGNTFKKLVIISPKWEWKKISLKSFKNFNFKKVKSISLDFGSKVNKDADIYIKEIGISNVVKKP